MWQRWMVVHRIALKTVLPVLRRVPYRLANRFLSLMGRLDLLVVPFQTGCYERAVADGARRLGLGCAWNVHAVSRALARQTYRWRVRDLLLDGRSDDEIAPLFDVSGRAHLDAALAEGRGVILLANHFGSHVLMTHWLFRQGYPLRWLGERPRQVSEYVSRQFETDGPLGQAELFVSRKAETAALASAVYHAARVLNAGLIVKIACDVRWHDAKAAPARFLGREDYFSTTWITLAGMTGAAVLPTFCRMEEDGRFSLEFQAPFRVPTEARRPALAGAWVQRAIDALEDQVRRYPAQSNDYFFWPEAGPATSESPSDRRRPARRRAVDTEASRSSS